MLILLGSGLAALGALLGKNPQRGLLGVAFVLLAVGVGALFGLSAVGGVGGRSGHSMWWLLAVVPYPVGWIMGLGGVFALVGKGWHRRLLLGGVLLSVTGLGALILLCTLRGVGGGDASCGVLAARHLAPRPRPGRRADRRRPPDDQLLPGPRVTIIP